MLLEQGSGKVATNAAVQGGKQALRSADRVTHGNSLASTKPTGSYELVFESGKTYNGMGSQKRMEQFAKALAAKHSDPVKTRTWTSASKGRAQAAKQEHKGLMDNGGPRDENNYNQVNSPGKKL